MTDSVTTRYAGTRMPRVEDTRLLTGHGTFVDDIIRPGMLHACFVRSPFARATITGIDTSAALAMPGVVAVFTAQDLNPDVREAWHAVAGKDVPDTPRPPPTRWPRPAARSTRWPSTRRPSTSPRRSRSPTDTVRGCTSTVPSGSSLRRRRTIGT